MMTLQITWFGSDITKRGTIYYYDDWRNNPRPTQMLGTRVAPDHLIQETVFSSRKRAVVNFGNKEFIFEGKIIKTKGFIVI